MRDGINVFMMEGEDGEVGVQLYTDEGKLTEMFDNLTTTQGGRPARATMISLGFEEGKPVSVSAKSKELPVEPVPAKERPDGIRLGEGPVFLPKDEKEKEDEDEESDG